ncbi:hypothetical protein C2S52_022927 [Perilla frutescens var. hirtella]|nr:hypothetical protein C2S52_022927 [Perilla frutescens var. hirtella]KAH6774479.1 hypothetical protein C2S51_012883 [Perilla frutescens var. frutescens]
MGSWQPVQAHQAFFDLKAVSLSCPLRNFEADEPQGDKGQGVIACTRKPKLAQLRGLIHAAGSPMLLVHAMCIMMRVSRSLLETER